MNTLDYYKSIDYDIIIRKEEMDGNVWYTAYCNEFGDAACHGIGATREEALNSFLTEKDFFIEFLYSKREPIPEKMKDSQYSGNFSVRTSSWIHSLLIKQAKDNGVSLNAYINQILAFHIGQNNVIDRVESAKREISSMMSEQFHSLCLAVDEISYNRFSINPVSRSRNKVNNNNYSDAA